MHEGRVRRGIVLLRLEPSGLMGALEDGQVPSRQCELTCAGCPQLLPLLKLNRLAEALEPHYPIAGREPGCKALWAAVPALGHQGHSVEQSPVGWQVDG